MQRRSLYRTARPDAEHDYDSAEAPVRGVARREIAARILDVARARPIAAFTAMLVAGYLVGRVLRR